MCMYVCLCVYLSDVCLSVCVLIHESIYMDKVRRLDFSFNYFMCYNYEDDNLNVNVS